MNTSCTPKRITPQLLAERKAALFAALRTALPLSERKAGFVIVPLHDRQGICLGFDGRWCLSMSRADDISVFETPEDAERARAAHVALWGESSSEVLPVESLEEQLG